MKHFSINEGDISREGERWLCVIVDVIAWQEQTREQTSGRGQANVGGRAKNRLRVWGKANLACSSTQQTSGPKVWRMKGWVVKVPMTRICTRAETVG